MNLQNQKVLAAKVAGVGTSRIILVPERVSEIKDAITKADIRALIKSGAIRVVQAKTPSRVRAKARAAQKKRGRRRGSGRRKGSQSAREPAKQSWMRKIRLMRQTLHALKRQDKISQQTYNEMYRRAKGGFFRDRGHIMFYLQQNKLLKK